jgi:HD-GYP domain-containing protein (c-di-GMP phosphodiesterase class II)
MKKKTSPVETAPIPAADGLLRGRIREIHWAVRSFMPFVARVAVAIYDPKTAELRSFIHSGDGDDPMSRSEMPTGDLPSLRKLLEAGHPRVIEHMLTFEEKENGGIRRLGRSGYAASYTLPMFAEGAFLGFVFFNSREPEVFTKTAVAQLDIFGHLVSLLVIQELAGARSLSSTLENAHDAAHDHDAETGSHLDRMSRYARLIAGALAGRHGLDEAYVERIKTYAPLHDIGKVGIPDTILLKPDGLTEDEMAVMRTHANRGQAIIDELLTNFGLGTLADIELVRNITLLHHERVDGKGYPYGLAGDAIPLEARIIAVADVFDALTSRRPYKEAFTNDEAFLVLGELAGSHLDEECVHALVEAREEVERIQAKFREDPLG